MDVERFRKDFLARKASTGLKQVQLCALYGVQQGTLSRFIKGKTSISFESVLKLWPFVYQAEFPEARLEDTPHASEA